MNLTQVNNMNITDEYYEKIMEESFKKYCERMEKNTEKNEYIAKLIEELKTNRPESVEEIIAAAKKIDKEM